MATRVVVCSECDEPLPYGRLSCPSCGALLASVAGTPRRTALHLVGGSGSPDVSGAPSVTDWSSADDPSSVVEPASVAEAPSVTASSSGDEPGSGDEPRIGDEPLSMTGAALAPVEDDWTWNARLAAVAAATTTDAQPDAPDIEPVDPDAAFESDKGAEDMDVDVELVPADTPEPAFEPADAAEPSFEPVDDGHADTAFELADTAEPAFEPDDTHAEAAFEPAGTAEPADDAAELGPANLTDTTDADTADPAFEPAHVAEPRWPGDTAPAADWPLRVPGAATVIEPAPDRAAATAVPPVLREWTAPDPAPSDDEPLRHPWAGAMASNGGPVLYPSAARGAAAAVAAPPAGAWVPPALAAAAAGPIADAVMAAPASVADPAPAPRVRPGDASLLADLPFDAPNDVAGWLVAIGSVVAMVGFLLPWSEVVIGSANFNGYTDRWGLAATANILALAVSALTFTLGVLPNRVPVWLRSGVLGLALGGLLLGLVWPYILVLRGAGLGAIAVAVGALVLVVGGLLAVRPRRHGPQAPAV